ncbi:hypothetical protein RHMOL_Rhmol13G0157000 [Rhododendron molle]|uniref:Uncharacterized protein n=1 Tax=Rhododendron molle TaxID=49168 RepID=A0ACC0L7P0_RHOML|nr:hypothetical protein RHMOL_Rhmol13G0157000 [Rhododendron molle]
MEIVWMYFKFSSNCRRPIVLSNYPYIACWARIIAGEMIAKEVPFYLAMDLPKKRNRGGLEILQISCNNNMLCTLESRKNIYDDSCSRKK